jgi:hypothetical protein
MNQCFGAVENMFQAKLSPPNLSNFKRKSLSDLADHPPKRQATIMPNEPLAAPTRVIQPRPPPNGYPQASSVSSSPALTATGKKRGRPSKADKEAQARAHYSRSMEYAPITPAPLAPLPLQPQRDYVSPPGYEAPGSASDLRAKKRGRLSAVDSVQSQQTGSSHLIASPAATDVPRGMPESAEHAERGTLSPRDRGPAAVDSRSPTLLPHPQQREHVRAHSPLTPHGQPLPAPPQHSQPPKPYEPYRVTDPIFPDRDRSRDVPERPRQESAAPPSIVNRG